MKTMEEVYRALKVVINYCGDDFTTCCSGIECGCRGMPTDPEYFIKRDLEQVINRIEELEAELEKEKVAHIQTVTEAYRDIKKLVKLGREAQSELEKERVDHAKEKEVTNFYSHTHNWNSEDYQENISVIDDCVSLGNFDYIGGKRARQRIKDRDV